MLCITQFKKKKKNRVEGQIWALVHLLKSFRLIIFEKFKKLEQDSFKKLNTGIFSRQPHRRRFHLNRKQKQKHTTD